MCCIAADTTSYRMSTRENKEAVLPNKSNHTRKHCTGMTMSWVFVYRMFVCSPTDCFWLNTFGTSCRLKQRLVDLLSLDPYLESEETLIPSFWAAFSKKWRRSLTAYLFGLEKQPIYVLFLWENQVQTANGNLNNLLIAFGCFLCTCALKLTVVGNFLLGLIQFVKKMHALLLMYNKHFWPVWTSD